MAQLEYKLVIPENAMPQITLLPPPVVHSTDDMIMWNGSIYKKVDDVLTFKTNKHQHGMLYDIERAMRENGLSEGFIDDVIELALRDAGIYVLCDLWYNETNETERREIIKDLRNSIVDYGYEYSLADLYTNTGGCDYVVRQEIMDDKNVMQLEYWNEYLGGWQFKKSDATLFYRDEAIEVVKSLRNPPSDGRVHIAKRTKKAKPQSQLIKDEYVICRTVPIRGLQYYNEGTDLFTDDVDRATKYNVHAADSRIKNRCDFFSGCEVFLVKKAKPAKKVKDVPACDKKVWHVNCPCDKNVEFRIEKGNQ